MSSADLASWKEAFSLFDKRGNGKVTKDTVGDLLRAIGQNPTQAEVADIEDGLPSDVDFETFKKVVQRPDGFRPPADPEDLVRGFQIFDKDGTGYIGVGELKYVLTSLGERMSTEDVEELLKGVDIKNDSVNYSDFVKMILSN